MEHLDPFRRIDAGPGLVSIIRCGSARQCILATHTGLLK
jgi:hypothetical protein